MAVTEKDLEKFSELIDQKLKTVTTQMSGSFRLINSKLDTQKNELSRIKEQTTKTNGHVAELDTRVNLIEKEEIRHIITCPQIEAIEALQKDLNDNKDDSNKKIDDINKNLVEYDMLKKYPKIGLGIVAVSCIALIIATYTVLSTFMNDLKGDFKTELKMEIKKEIFDSINN